MKIVLLTNAQANQRALASKLSDVADLRAVVVSKNIPRSRPVWAKRVRLTVNAVGGKLLGKPLIDGWKQMLSGYESEFPRFPSARQVFVNNVNDEGTIKTIIDENPDLVVVSGTNLVGSRVIEAGNRLGGILNLHTGISPYVRGGPNCTYWCLAKGWFDRIGNTIMWLDKGIDTGNIVTTERTRLDGSETLATLQRKVMDHAHTMYVRALERMDSGLPLPSVDQSSIASGVHFNSVDWSVSEMRSAIRNFRNGYRAAVSNSDRLSGDLRLVSLSDV